MSNIMKGIIALDIDGVVAIDSSPPEPSLITFLTRLEKEGWNFIFITGRSLEWSKRILASLPFPYTLAVQNGALTLLMPEERLVQRLLIDKAKLEGANQIAREEGIPYVFYTGDAEDRVVWNPALFDETSRTFLEQRSRAYKENWQASEVIPETFSALKWIGEKSAMERVAQKVEERLALHCTAIRDPFDPSQFVAQATHPLATKGEALKLFKAGKKGVVIAAGDDHNDRPLLEAADIRIAMPNAPDSLKALAHLIAEGGIIRSIEEAINYE